MSFVGDVWCCFKYIVILKYDVDLLWSEFFIVFGSRCIGDVRM